MSDTSSAPMSDSGDRAADMPPIGRPRTIQVEVRKKRTFVNMTPEGLRAVEPEPTAAPPTVAQSGEGVGEQRAPSEGSDQSSAPRSGSDVVALQIPPFVPVSTVPCEPPAWLIPGLLKKKGVTLLVAPPGACFSALCTFFALTLSGKDYGPLGAVRYPGDVMLTTHTPHLDRSLRALLMATNTSMHTAFTRKTKRRFNWRTPALTLKEVTEGRKPGTLAALIIDAGDFPTRVDASIVESAHAAFSEISETLDCQVIVVVESTSRSIDPFERVPKNLRVLRDTLLAVPLRAKVLQPQTSTPPEFMLMRLSTATATAFTVRFALHVLWDAVEASRIVWTPVVYDDPRAAFKRAETADLTAAERAAVTLAADVIRQRGPTSSKELQAVGRLNGVPPTTMRDALTVADLLGHLKCRRFDDGRWYWGIPGATPAIRF
jgi:hypothetical protein